MSSYQARLSCSPWDETRFGLRIAQAAYRVSLGQRKSLFLSFAGWDDIVTLKGMLTAAPSLQAGITVLMLHSMVPPAEQKQAFSRAPVGVRKASLIPRASARSKDAGLHMPTGLDCCIVDQQASSHIRALLEALELYTASLLPQR